MAFAESYSNAADLQNQIREYLNKALQGAYPGVGASDMEIEVSNLDPRLKLDKCDSEVQYTVVSQRPYGANISVKAQCTGIKPWTIYVPARVDTYAPVAVASRSLARGTVLTEADVLLTRMNTAQAGYSHLRDLDLILGRELKRHLRAGDPLRQAHLKAPLVVRRGDRVMMEAGTASVTVVTAGRALADGQAGDRIQVQNEKSQRIVEAEVLATGRVRIAL